MPIPELATDLDEDAKLTKVPCPSVDLPHRASPAFADNTPALLRA